MHTPIILFVSFLISIWSSIAFSQTLSVEDIIKDVSPAVVKIVVYDITGTKRGEGSGFFIGRGRIVTNAHVVESAYSAEIHSFLKTYEHVTITKRDDKVDLALLSVQDVGEPTIALADSSDLRPGQRVLAIGNPLGLERTVSDGLISAVRGITGKIQLIQISAPISPGSSGGPLLNMQAYVIGVTSGSISEGQSLNFAIGIETLKQFLQMPDNPEPLKKARTRVLWRSIIKWVVNIVLGIIVLAFGGGWWIIFVVFMVLTLVFYILKGAWGLITAPFRRKAKPGTMLAEEYQYPRQFDNMQISDVGRLKPGKVVEKVNEVLGPKTINPVTHRYLYTIFDIRPVQKSEDPLDPFETNADYCHYDEAHGVYVYNEDWVNFIIHVLQTGALTINQIRKHFGMGEKLNIEDYEP